MERKKKEPGRHQQGLRVGSEQQPSKSRGGRGRLWYFDYSDKKNIRSFLVKVMNDIFDYNPNLRMCYPTEIIYDGRREFVINEVVLPKFGGIDDNLLPPIGRELTVEESLKCMEKRVYYDKHYYYILDDPSHLSYVKLDDLILLNDNDDPWVALEPFDGERKYLETISSYQNKPTKEIISNLKEDWNKQGYACISVEDGDIDLDLIDSLLNSEKWRKLKSSDDTKYNLVCGCGHEFETDIQTTVLNLGDGVERVVIGATCPKCGKFVGESILRGRCRYCHEKFEIKIQGKGAYPVYCSDECKRNYRRFENRWVNYYSGGGSPDFDLDKLEALYRMGISPKSLESQFMVSRCQNCGKTIPPERNIGARFCCDSCKRAFKYRLKKEQAIDPNITEKDLVHILRREKHQDRIFKIRIERLKWWIVGGASLQHSFVDYYRDLLGDDFDRVVRRIEKENKLEKNNPNIQEKNRRRLKEIIWDDKLDVYPATESFYLKGYFGDEFDDLVSKLKNEVKIEKELRQDDD